MGRLMRLAGFLLLLGCAGTGMAQNNPCAGDIIGKRPGSSPYVPPRDCNVIIMSEARYEEMGIREAYWKTLAEKQKALIFADSLRILTTDSLVQVLRAQVSTAEGAAAQYKSLYERADALAQDCQRNTDRCTNELALQRRRCRWKVVAGFATGAIVGFVAGILL